MKKLLRCVLSALLLKAGLACAQGGIVDVTPPSPAKSLACLQRPTEAIKFPVLHAYDHSSGMLRVLLRFEKPDAEPNVTVLSNTARQDMQDLVFAHLAKYRLPCLTPQDGAVTAVQEFNFNNSDMEPTPMVEPMMRSACFMTQSEPMPSINTKSRANEHVVLNITFEADGNKSPTSKLVYSTGDKGFEEAAIEYAAGYRMPCRGEGKGPITMRQIFHYKPAIERGYVFKRDAMSLWDFLAMTKDILKVEAEFDFKTMNCPFKVNYMVLSPHLPNEANANDAPLAARDPNRVAFLKWMAERQINFQSDKQDRDLFGSVLQINIPCAVLSLHPNAAAVPAAAVSAGG